MFSAQVEITKKISNASTRSYSILLNRRKKPALNMVSGLCMKPVTCQGSAQHTHSMDHIQNGGRLGAATLTVVDPTVRTYSGRGLFRAPNHAW